MAWSAHIRRSSSSGAGSANASGASKRRRLSPRGTRQNKPISSITSNDDDDDGGGGGGKGRKKSGGGGRRGGEKGREKSGSGPDVRQQNNRYGYKYEFKNLGSPGDYEMESNSDDEGIVHAQPGFVTHHRQMIKDELEEGQQKGSGGGLEFCGWLYSPN